MPHLLRTIDTSLGTIIQETQVLNAFLETLAKQLSDIGNRVAGLEARMAHTPPTCQPSPAPYPPSEFSATYSPPRGASGSFELCLPSRKRTRTESGPSGHSTPLPASQWSPAALGECRYLARRRDS